MPQVLLFLIVSLLGLAAGQSQPGVQALIRSGQAALDSGNFARAVSDFQQAWQIAPENVEVNRGLLLSYLQAGDLNEAVQFGTTAVQHWPNDSQLQHWLGLAYFKSGSNADAVRVLRSAESLDVKSFDIHFDLALVLLAENQATPAAEEPRSFALKPPSEASHTRNDLSLVMNRVELTRGM